MSLLAESSLSQDVRSFQAFSHHSPASGASNPNYGYKSYGNKSPKSGQSPSKKTPSKSLGFYKNNMSPQTSPMRSNTADGDAYEYGLVNGYYYYFDGVTFYGVPATPVEENQSNSIPNASSPSNSSLSSSKNKSEPVPLENSWCFWFDKYLGPGLTLSEYEASMKNLGSFSTVQEFWKYYNNITSASKLPPKTSYHLMKAGTKPLWEDEANMNGGSFSFRIHKELSDSAWLHILLGIIGEQFDEALNYDSGDDICGVSISRRRDENVINIWHKRAAVVDKEKFSNFLCKILSRVSSNFIPVLNYKVHQTEENFKSQTSPTS